MNLEKTAIENGFDWAKAISTDQLSFDFSLRKFCEENLCGHYGDNYACPPNCGTPQEMKDQALRYKNALVLRKRVDVVSYEDKEVIQKAQEDVRITMVKLEKKFRKGGYQGLSSMPGECHVCKECELIFGRECRSPESIASCISAYCIDMKELAKECDLEFAFEEGKVAFFCLYLF